MVKDIVQRPVAGEEAEKLAFTRADVGSSGESVRGFALPDLPY
jgi:hypothetical protein